MGEMDLIYLVVGIGLGVVGSRIARSSKEPASQVSVPQAMPPEISQPLQAVKEESSPPNDELQPLKEELKQTKLAYQMAHEMSQFKSGFLARTSHELRSPLSSLIGLHQLILSDLCDSPEEERQFVAQANASALKMVKLLDDVVKVSKTEHGTNQLDIRSLSLTKVFEDVQRLTYMQAANRNLQLEVIFPDPEIYVLADAQRFQQVLLGIVDSAIAQMEEGSIRVSAASFSESKEVQILFDIQCPTELWSESIDLLSKPPEAEEQAIEVTKGSPGLNLLIAHSLAEVMQGRLELLSTSGEEASDNSASANQKTTKIQFSIPLGTLETVEPVSA
ncbi:MAG: HAMP domain-containing histidine kinase [Microcoleus sp. SIO2G3]|nr:HAMP domain-containing histidine kinase [Microcoleus sp. SIO2G3]